MVRATTISIVHEDPFTAGRDAARELLSSFGGDPELCVLFASAELDPRRVLDGFWSAMTPGVRVVGCTSFAEVNAEEGLSGSVTVMGMSLGGISFEPVSIPQEGDGMEASRAVGRELGERLAAFEPSLIMIFPDGIRTRATPMLEGIQEVLGAGVPVIGGLSAAKGDMSESYEFFDREVLSGGVVGVALKGRLELVTGAKTGWRPAGPPRTCTRIEEGRGIAELDGQPAGALYLEYLGERAREMPLAGLEYPLGVVGGGPQIQRLPEGEPVVIVRAVVGIDEQSQTLLCLGEIPPGSEVCMMKATKDELIRASNDVGAAALQAMPDPDLALIFTCLGRKLVLGPRYKEELKGTLARLADTPTIGFYTYGELSPVHGVTRHHHETFTIALIKAS